MNDYVTINVNKRFLKVAVVLLSLVGSHIGTYKYGFNKGIKTAIDYFVNRMSSSGADDNESDARKNSDEKTHQGSSIRF